LDSASASSRSTQGPSIARRVLDVETLTAGREIKLDADKPKRKIGIPASLSDAAGDNDLKYDEIRKAVLKLTDEQRAELRAAYIAAHPDARFNEETRRWNEPAHTARYCGFELVQRAA
jgi:hypothetical protein